MKTKTYLAGIAVGALFATQAAAEMPGEFSANVALTNDYVWRGFSQSDEEFAIQGGMDWDSGVGAYVGVWASSVNFGDGDEASTELDIYAGYAGELGGGLTYDIGFIYYLYPGASSALDYDFWEVYGGLGYDFEVASVSASVSYADDTFGNGGETWYFTGGVAVPVGEMLSVDANIGYYDFQGGGDYTDWNIGATVATEWFDIDLRYIDTDLKTFEHGGLADSRAVVTISKSF